MYSTCTRVHARIPIGHPREEKRASDKSPRTSRRAERAARAATGRLPGARRLPREDPRAEVGEDVGVGVRVGSVEFKLNGHSHRQTHDDGIPRYHSVARQNNHYTKLTKRKLYENSVDSSNVEYARLMLF